LRNVRDKFSDLIVLVTKVEAKAKVENKLNLSLNLCFKI